MDPGAAGVVLASLRSHPLGREAAVIGEVTAATGPRVLARTPLGATRLVPEPPGEQLPRIC